MGMTTTTTALDRRLARIEGQVAGLRRMLAEDQYCLEILTQLSATKSALEQVGVEIVTRHVDRCIVGSGCCEKSESPHPHAQAMSHDELMDELRTALARVLR